MATLRAAFPSLERLFVLESRHRRFAQKSPEELYRRWVPFGMLTSHSRCHGAPPKEPWEYSAAFLDDFRRPMR